MVHSNPFKRFRRSVQISRVLLKYGFGEYIKTLHPSFLLAQLGLGRNNIEFRPVSQRLKLALEELGPTFIKIGQVLSTRGDLLSDAFTKELAKLQDSVKPEPFASLKKIIESEIGPIDKIFEDFDKEPVGSASIAQVYRAKFQGNEVIIKVRRPRIEEIIETDIAILKRIASIMERNISYIRERRPKELVETFARTIHRELDFLNEVNNIEKFRENFQNDNRIYLPKIYREISTSKVLIQEHIDGIKISDIARMKENGINPKVVAENGATIFLKQIFIHGFFHADPHPGNLFVKDGNVITPIDFGMVGRITTRMKEQLTDFLLGIIERNPDTIVRSLKKIGIIENGFEPELLKEDILYVLDKFEGRSLKQISVSEFISDINRVIRKYHIRIPQDLLYLGKTLLQLESIGRELDSNFDIIKFLKEFIRKNRIGVLSIRDIISQGKWWLKDVIMIFKDLPENLNNLFMSRRTPIQINRTEKEQDNPLHLLLSGFGIMAISIFIFFITNLPILRFFAILGLIFSFAIFVIQIFITLLR